MIYISTQLNGFSSDPHRFRNAKTVGVSCTLKILPSAISAARFFFFFATFIFLLQTLPI